MCINSSIVKTLAVDESTDKSDVANSASILDSLMANASGRILFINVAAAGNG